MPHVADPPSEPLKRTRSGPSVPVARREAPAATPSGRRRKRLPWAWAALVAGLAALTAGLLLPDGVLIAAGLVLGGLSAHLFER